jgi:hypothetical protein
MVISVGGDDSSLSERDIEATAKCPAFDRQVVAVESIFIDLDLDDDELND